MGLADGGPVEDALSAAASAAFSAKIGAWLTQHDVAADPKITAEYVMVMVSNKKDRAVVSKEMEMFLSSTAPAFTNWCALSQGALSCLLARAPGADTGRAGCGASFSGTSTPRATRRRRRC